ncbi:hypothetical protein B0O80DRAFT_473645 [Mortierella sp. GBAus27b]|nr:hypothetical protein B0O80DRAFT_473645 [Mortierella sp. GBAus27b]
MIFAKSSDPWSDLRCLPPEYQFLLCHAVICVFSFVQELPEVLGSIDFRWLFFSFHFYHEGK